MNNELKILDDKLNLLLIDFKKIMEVKVVVKEHLQIHQAEVKEELKNAASIIENNLHVYQLSVKEELSKTAAIIKRDLDEAADVTKKDLDKAAAILEKNLKIYQEGDAAFREFIMEKMEDIQDLNSKLRYFEDIIVKLSEDFKKQQQ